MNVMLGFPFGLSPSTSSGQALSKPCGPAGMQPFDKLRANGDCK